MSQPGIDILAAQACRVPMTLHPGGVDEQAFGKGPFKKVQLSRFLLSHTW